MHDIEEYVIHIRNLKQALNLGLVFQKAWLKFCFDLNTQLKKMQKMTLKNTLFRLMNNVVFGNTMENMRKHRDIKLVTTKGRRNFLVSESNYHTT